ncbi:ribonuclease D [Pseudohongiella sp.]|uniref:HRDC domain-containing protein n=1 Tax=marine sediment metagenome TaxID=412755 RepID=A0A0F9VZM4_9ZZZZ|nr:ribonuclease D [Pseudohongiella sp.]HDZ09714.1 ribonuclease D [Pseudohongiella sp.]HEA61672.1 ribonuclease D [Pseudohongiella sp.]
MTDFPAPELVIDDARLAQLCQSWRTLPTLALDTEFIRVSTFYPRAGLVQVGDGNGTYLLDPLSIQDWQPFIDILTAPDITKIMHSCSEDLVVFNYFYNCMPGPIFDTQKAAGFLGHGYSISYLNLVLHITGVELSKGETRSDWLKRPLSENQVKYAALDVAYLPRLHAELKAALTREGKLDYLRDECERMRQISLAAEDPANWPDLYLSMGAAWRLNAKQLGALKDLCIWREQVSRQRDKPRAWIARDADLITLAQQLPATHQALTRLPDLNRNIYQQDADALLAIIRDSEPVADGIANNLEGEPMSQAQRATLKRCQQAVRAVAAQTGIAEELLARKKQLITLMHLNRHATNKQAALVWPADLSGWQQPLLAAPLTDIITDTAIGKGSAGEANAT